MHFLEFSRTIQTIETHLKPETLNFSQLEDVSFLFGVSSSNLPKVSPGSRKLLKKLIDSDNLMMHN